MKTPLLTVEELHRALLDLPGWTVLPDRPAIVREFQFKDFGHAFSFMTLIALKAEKMDHHPEWSNAYNQVRIVLSTHDSGGVTSLDLELARFVQQARE